MDFDEIERILEMMREHELIEFELERDNFKLRLRKNAVGPGGVTTTGAAAAATPAHEIGRASCRERV